MGLNPEDERHLDRFDRRLDEVEVEVTRLKNIVRDLVARMEVEERLVRRRRGLAHR